MRLIALAICMAGRLGSGGRSRSACPSPLVGEGVAERRRMSNCVSGFAWIPGSVVSEHGTEDGHDLSRHGDEGDLWLLTVGNETRVEGPEYGIGAAGGERCHGDHPAQGMTAAPDDAATFEGAGVEVVGRQTC